MTRLFRTLEDLGLHPWHRGKVRETCDLGERLLIVTTDRISAFDCVLPGGLPGKGILLNRLSAFWLRGFARWMPTHFLSDDEADLPAAFAPHRQALAGRWMLVRKAERVPVECVVRGYLTGSGWAEYRASGTVCGIPLPAGLREFDRLPAPLFTPTTKADEGHDQPLTPAQTGDLVGAETARALERLALEVYRRGADYALDRGIIIADTKFEFGFIDGRLSLIDEVLTPDSSRFWPRASWAPGRPPEPLDKQYVRDYLKGLDWDRNPPAPPLPEAIAGEALERYRRACETLTEGRPEPEWRTSA
jgi:phosphoribosylaminoimidazole-succinocarboxamide synthase